MLVTCRPVDGNAPSNQDLLARIPWNPTLNNLKSIMHVSSMWSLLYSNMTRADDKGGLNNIKILEMHESDRILQIAHQKHSIVVNAVHATRVVPLSLNALQYCLNSNLYSPR